MKQIPIEYKSVKYSRFGTTVGGLYSKGLLTINEKGFTIEPKKWKLLEFIIRNNKSLRFDYNQKIDVYKNQFQEYKIKYPTYYCDNEITFKTESRYYEIIDEFILQRYKD